jgi:hypothetical protein
MSKQRPEFTLLRMKLAFLLNAVKLLELRRQPVELFIAPDNPRTVLSQQTAVFFFI